MSIRIGIVTVRDSQYHPNRRLAEAATAKGHTVVLIHPYRLWPGFLASDEVTHERPTIVGLEEKKWPHAILPRQGADVGPSCLPFIQHCRLMQIPVVNDFDAVRISRHQFYTLQAFQAAGIPFPPSVFVNSGEGLFQAIEALGGYPVVVKQVSGRQGSGVSKVESVAAASTIIAAHMKKVQQERPGLLVQRYLPTHGRRDIRVLVVGQRVAGAQELTLSGGDFRSNAHLGAQGRQFTLTATIEELALKAARAVGLEIAGIDLMVAQGASPLVGEINYAPGFKLLEATTGHDIAAEMVDYVVKRIRKEEVAPCACRR